MGRRNGRECKIIGNTEWRRATDDREEIEARQGATLGGSGIVVVVVEVRNDLLLIQPTNDRIQNLKIMLTCNQKTKRDSVDQEKTCQ